MPSYVGLLFVGLSGVFGAAVLAGALGGLTGLLFAVLFGVFGAAVVAGVLTAGAEVLLRAFFS